MCVTIGVPILLAYIYGVVPISLCRSGGCGVITSAAGVRIAFDDEEGNAQSTGSSKHYSSMMLPASVRFSTSISGEYAARAVGSIYCTYCLFFFASRM